MADPTAVQMEGFGILFIPLSANFSWMSVYYYAIITYYVRIKNDGIRPLRTYASQLDYYTPGSMQLHGGDLTRAPLGYFYNAPHWGGGLFRAPPLISETTGPILKIQAAFESPGKTVEGKQILLTSGSRVTSQVRSKSKCSTFRAW